MSDSQTERAELREQQAARAAQREHQAAARAERKEERAAARTAHVASQFWTYLLASVAGFVVALALYNNLVPALWTSYWGDVAALFAMLVGVLLMWLAEHTRPAVQSDQDSAGAAGLAHGPSADST
jgi:hypothetical protein